MLRTTLLLIVTVLALVAADKLTPATIVLVDGTTFNEAYVVKEGLTEVQWSRDEGGKARTTTPADRIDRIDYTLPRQERAYVRALGAYNSKNWDGAADAFVTAIEEARSPIWKIKGRLLRAEALGKIKRYDEAVKVLGEIESEFGEWRYVVEAKAKAADLLAESGAADKAVAAYRDLGSKAGGYGPRWGATARALAAEGEAGILRGQGKAAEAAGLLGKALSGIDANRAPDQYGRLASALAADLASAGKAAEAKGHWEKLRYLPVDARYRVSAFLGLGKLKKESGDKVAALDLFATAAVLRGGDGKARSEARNLAKALCKELANDESLDDASRAEYRAYGSRL
jgi:tetratricopeptide (TPR) repeat protein